MGPGVLGVSLPPPPARTWSPCPPGGGAGPLQGGMFHLGKSSSIPGPPCGGGEWGPRAGVGSQGESEALRDEGQGAEANRQGQEEGQSLDWGFTRSSAHKSEQLPGLARGKRKAQGSTRIELPLRARILGCRQN